MRVLIVSPHFPPSNSADLHRVRLLLPYLAEQGWDTEVLSVEPAQVAGPLDYWLEAGLPPQVTVHRVRALSLQWAKIPGLGTLGFRALRALGRQGDILLSGRKFDLIYFSTTVFEVHVLGPWWKKKFGVPFILDYQDPWVNEYYREHPTVRPPGGRLKYATMDLIHRFMEPRVLRECSGITSVSSAYPLQLERRYPSLGILPTLIQSFPGDSSDLRRAACGGGGQCVFQPGDGVLHWVYAGVVIPAMHATLRAFFRALRQALDGGWEDNLRIHFIGTNYAADAQPVVVPIAVEYGLMELVEELPHRIPYSEVLVCLADADALLVIGSDDPGYTASKIYPYLLAGKPLLTVFHEQSSVVSLMRKVGGGVCVAFSMEESEEVFAGRIGKAWFESHRWAQKVALDEVAFDPYTAPAAAREMGKFFHGCLESARRK